MKASASGRRHQTHFRKVFRGIKRHQHSRHGLGLNIVRRYADLLNGNLSFDSQYGIGSTFTITLLFNKSYEKILLIEDNTEVRENTSEIISLANYEVLRPKTAKWALNWRKKKKPDLIICDIMMPELDGYRVLHILKKPETAGIPFIFLTAKPRRAMCAKAWTWVPMITWQNRLMTPNFERIEMRLKRTEMFRSYESSPEGLRHSWKMPAMPLTCATWAKIKENEVVQKENWNIRWRRYARTCVFVKSGNVKVYKSHPDGKELITNLYKANDFFGFWIDSGELALQRIGSGHGRLRSGCYPQARFPDACPCNAEVSNTFISLLCQKVKRKKASYWTWLQLSSPTHGRSFVESFSTWKTTIKNFSVSRDDLAKMVGTASESVIRVLSDFKDEGLIDIESGKIKIIAPGKLESVIRWNVAR